MRNAITNFWLWILATIWVAYHWKQLSKLIDDFITDPDSHVKPVKSQKV